MCPALPQKSLERWRRVCWGTAARKKASQWEKDGRDGDRGGSGDAERPRNINWQRYKRTGPQRSPLVLRPGRLLYSPRFVRQGPRICGFLLSPLWRPTRLTPLLSTRNQAIRPHNSRRRRTAFSPASRPRNRSPSTTKSPRMPFSRARAQTPQSRSRLSASPLSSGASESPVPTLHRPPFSPRSTCRRFSTRTELFMDFIGLIAAAAAGAAQVCFQFSPGFKHADARFKRPRNAVDRLPRHGGTDMHTSSARRAA